MTRKQVEEIAKTKMPDLNAASLEAAVKTVEGTARSMGLEVRDNEMLGNAVILNRRLSRESRDPASQKRAGA